MLIISDDEVRVLKMTECIEAMERAFAEEARGIAVNRPRMRYKVPPDLMVPGYMANIIAGAVPSSGVAAFRYDSAIGRSGSSVDSDAWTFPLLQREAGGSCFFSAWKQESPWRWSMTLASRRSGSARPQVSPTACCRRRTPSTSRSSVPETRRGETSRPSAAFAK